MAEWSKEAIEEVAHVMEVERDSELANVLRHIGDVADAWRKRGAGELARHFDMLAEALRLGAHRQALSTEDRVAVIARMLQNAKLIPPGAP